MHCSKDTAQPKFKSNQIVVLSIYHASGWHQDKRRHISYLPNLSELFNEKTDTHQIPKTQAASIMGWLKKKKATGFKEMRRILKNSSSSIRVENLRMDRIRVKRNGFPLKLILFPGKREKKNRAIGWHKKTHTKGTVRANLGLCTIRGGGSTTREGDTKLKVQMEGEAGPNTLLMVPGMAFFRIFHQRRRKWQPTPVLLLRESYGQRSLVGCCP